MSQETYACENERVPGGRGFITSTVAFLAAARNVLSRNYPIFSSSKFIVSKFSYKLYSNIVSKFRNVSNIHYYSHSQESLKRILERIHD